MAQRDGLGRDLDPVRHRLSFLMAEGVDRHGEVGRLLLLQPGLLLGRFPVECGGLAGRRHGETRPQPPLGLVALLLLLLAAVLLAPAAGQARRAPLPGHRAVGAVEGRAQPSSLQSRPETSTSVSCSL